VSVEMEYLYQIFHPLVRRHAPDKEEIDCPVPVLSHHRTVGRGGESLAIQYVGEGGGAGESVFLQLTPVEFRGADGKV